ncbi:MAG: nitroreductase family protein [Gemmatimonadetes bacterium]|nr:nitroreductase family protein [Gemmatimonadota bacterium]MDA1103155.1 nitroreductase family protein [Gemmatimonadota bacterium]
MPRAEFVPLSTYRELPEEEMRRSAHAFLETMRRRRTVREFSDRPVPRGVVEDCLLAAGTAPNGANRQPWRFVVISDPAIKAKIRTEAEIEEKEFYSGKAPPEWIEALEHLGTDEHKPFLERAPWLIAIFAESYEVLADGTKAKNYYVTESVGIATGMLITALHHAGLVTLTHTPSPMKFLNGLLGRPSNERPFLILVVGYPDEGATVPDITKKPIEDIAIFVE